MTKKIEAIIREEKLTAVKKALSDIGIVGLTITPVRGRGRGAGMTLKWRTGTYNVELLPRTKVEIVLSDNNVEAAVAAIKNAAKSGSPGDGMIFVMPVDNVIRISTDEEGKDALAYAGDIDTRGGS
ncbi:MAG: P-II family nitrogen regulator [Anaerolineales bacterium]